MIIMNVINLKWLRDDLDFCKNFLTASIPSVCVIVVYQDHTSNETTYESSVMLLTFSIFLMNLVVCLVMLAVGNDQQILIFC